MKRRSPAGGLEIGQNVDQIPVSLVVVPVHPPGPVPLAELHQEGGQVVGQVAIVEAGAPQRMPNEDIEEERLGRKQHRTHCQQPLDQVRRVEQ